MNLAERMSRIGTESAFEVLAQARALEQQGRDIIHLEIGQPDFPTPAHVVDAGKRALDEGWTGYGPTAGFPEFRDAIAAYVSRTRGIDVTAEHVVVVPGGKPIMFFVMLATLGRGDEVIYPNPGFPIYESVVQFAGATPVPMPLVESRGFSFDLDTFASITQFDGMVEKTCILDGFSKTYSMTGWRLGYGVMPRRLARAVELLMVNSNSCTASFTQRAGLAALTGPQEPVDTMVAEFRRRRDAIVDGLNRIPGFHCTVPEGAFYAFPNVSGTGITAKALAELLLNEAGVACLAGTAFGSYGEGYLRFSYAASLEHIAEALARIAPFSERWVAEASARV